mgnify:CR=1
MIKIISWIYLILWSLEILLMPFMFGKERKPYSPASWLGIVIFNLPLIWVLWQVINLK